jgi:predicted RNase H-like nuclease (RuvC/YqgF family)
MGVETSHSEGFRNLARHYVLGGLSFWDAITEAARLDSWSGIETFKSSAIYQLERAVETLCAENHALRTEIKELERKLDPFAAEEEAFEHEMESRLAREREVEAERRG